MTIRLPAEWEEQDFVMLVFPNIKSDWKHNMEEIKFSYIELIKSIQKYQKCVILCENKKRLSTLLPILKNILLIEIETNDTWIRDFGGICVFRDKELNIYNFNFNAWGGKFDSTKDNAVNKKLQNMEFFDAQLENIDFVLEGGSIDTNGHGAMLSTENCIFNQNRNPLYSKEQIIIKLKELFGVNELIMLKHGSLIGDDTDSHIDTLARFIDKNTIAYVKCYDELDIHFGELAMMEKELKETGYDLFPLPLPEAKFFDNQRLSATYLNFLFINNALIVPTYNDKNDKEVLEKLQNFFPAREVIGVDASIFIREHGSLHCASMNYFCYNSN